MRAGATVTAEIPPEGVVQTCSLLRKRLTAPPPDLDRQTKEGKMEKAPQEAANQ